MATAIMLSDSPRSDFWSWASAQPRNEQVEHVVRNHITFPVLNDSCFQLADALGLPTFTVDGRRFYKRLALVAIDNRIVAVTYPVFSPNRNAEQVLNWLARYFSSSE